ncbi:glycine/D-amino acid oxidase, deaminating [Actinobacteria bacterium IMCC26207]|nr:glycine/D-amino acid oxidase, deaminating [Actinobacteria bacterium IMCC26207]
MKDYRSLSLWLDSCGDDLTPREALPGDVSADVAIVGGGLTGLWAAHYLKSQSPDLRILVLEAEICGFGASGRNGGWCSALFPASLEQLAAMSSSPSVTGKRAAAIAQYRAMIETVTEVERVAMQLGIDADFARGGTLSLATNPAHIPRLRAEVDNMHAWGFGNEDLQWLEASQVAQRVRVSGSEGAAFTPHCAAVHPAKLVRGLARSVESAGVQIYEHTRVKSISPQSVQTDHGTVSAGVILQCLEGYTPQMSGQHRKLLPLYSLMIATEPLAEEIWQQIGLIQRETFTDGRHLLIYGQRTADNRFAFGGRGAPYHFGSAVKGKFDQNSSVFSSLERVLHELFPLSRGAAVTHRWGGPIAVPRDWTASVQFDPETAMGSAGGYVGDGLSTTNLAGRTLADLVLGVDSELVHLPWVGHDSPRWEPEPFRWMGVNMGRGLASWADRSERIHRVPALFAQRALGLFTGGH